MWLLNTDTLKLESFDGEIPRYAILSHRWVKNQEATFADPVGSEESTERLEGHEKIRSFCRKAREAKEPYAYVWVDTCCIDKKSSAELSEAINSMYKWYANADKCYVYLADVADNRSLTNSSWFGRGWTLQELLAPSDLEFYDAEWRFIASRQDLAQTLADCTGIPAMALHRFHPEHYCVALKMSWAAKRQTTREEDLAYCLLGIFDVNMPLIYGEGPKAFQRLQEEIMRTSTDASLFLWQGACCRSFGMLAAEPLCFSNIPDFLDEEHEQTSCKNPNGWTWNNAGMNITGTIHPYLLTEDGDRIFALSLHEPYASRSRAGIFLLRAEIFLLTNWGFQATHSYRRVAVDDKTCASYDQAPDGDLPGLFPFKSRSQQLFITRHPLTFHNSRGSCSFTVDFQTSPSLHCITKRRPSNDTSVALKDWPSLATEAPKSLEYVFEVDCASAAGLRGHIVVQIADGVELLICFGLGHFFLPICVIIPFCKHIYSKGLSGNAVMELCSDLLPDNKETGHKFDSEFHVSVSRGTDNGLEYSTELGVDLDIGKPVDTNKYHADMTFDAATFLQYYLSSAHMLEFNERGCLGEEATQALIECDSAVLEARRQNPWLS